MKTSRYETILDNLLSNYKQTLGRVVEENESSHHLDKSMGKWFEQNMDLYYNDYIQAPFLPTSQILPRNKRNDVDDFLNFFHRVNNFYPNDDLISICNEFTKSNKTFFSKFLPRRSGTSTFLASLAVYAYIKGLRVAVASDTMSSLNMLSRMMNKILETAADLNYYPSIANQTPNYICVNNCFEKRNIYSPFEGNKYDLVVYDVTDFTYECNSFKKDWLLTIQKYFLRENGFICALQNL